MLYLYELSRAYLKTTENLYLAAGQPKIMTKIKLLQLILIAVLIYPLTLRYGILGTGIATAVPSVLVLVITFNEAGKIIDKSFLTIARTIVPAAAGSFTMVTLVLL